MKNSKPKIAFGMIVFEGDYVLEACLAQVYPHATQILIAEGPVKFWQEKGRTTSTDKTNQIIDNFPDPENKIKIVHGQFSEKDEQCSAYMQHLNDDIDYLWNLDSDEIFKSKDIEKLINVMENEGYTSADVKSCSFYGGFDRYIGGFEERKGNFHRIFKVYPGSKWLTHRPPTVMHSPDIEVLPSRHVDGDTLWFRHGIRMYHYSYVFPKQVSNKIEYYEAKVSRDKCFKKYFNTIYLPWVQSTTDERKFKIEMINDGVHEFIKGTRPHTFTKRFNGTHPKEVQERLGQYQKRIQDEMSSFDVVDVECWKSNKVFQPMLDGATGKLWKKLEDSSHWPVLKKLLDYCKQSGMQTLCDVGCGAGALGKIYKDVEYTGVDLPDIVKNVSSVFAPELKFKEFNISDNISFLEEYDCLVLSAFIDVMEDPSSVLDKILKSSKKFVIIHRQYIGKESKSWLTTSYNQMSSFQSQLGIEDLRNIASKNGFSITQSLEIEGQNSIVLEKQ
jgi:hypothetical protein